MESLKGAMLEACCINKCRKATTALLLNVNITHTIAHKFFIYGVWSLLIPNIIANPNGILKEVLLPYE